ncbi:MAG TPA: HAD family phosphatase [Ktedonobacteraceae bacterium]|nr:HAD family phosphatase [Ktedonobacteraceae bacterium]
MVIRAIVFDIGGVLELDVIELVDIGLDARWERRLGLQPGELDQRMEPVWRAGSLGECAEEDVHQEMGKRLDMSQEQVEEYMHEMWDWYCGRLNVPMADFFRSLRPRYQTAILSNRFVGARREEQQRYQFEEMCDLIIYTHEEGIAKPDPRVYALTCKRLGVQPTEVVFLDDLEANVVAAREFGIHAVLFQETAQAIADIQAVLWLIMPDRSTAKPSTEECSHESSRMTHV